MCHNFIKAVKKKGHSVPMPFSVQRFIYRPVEARTDKLQNASQRILCSQSLVPFFEVSCVCRTTTSDYIRLFKFLVEEIGFCNIVCFKLASNLLVIVGN